MPLMVEHTGTGGTESSVMSPSGIALQRCAPGMRRIISRAGLRRAAPAPPIARSSRRAKAASPPWSMGAAFASKTAAKSASPASSAAGTDSGERQGRVVRHRRRPRRDAAWRRRRAGSLWPPGRLCVRGRLGTLGAKRAAAPRRGAGFRDISDKNCAAALAAAEGAARDAKLGIWADPSAIKNAESPGDILSAIGHFTVVEGRVLSVRQAGAITYLNFGRNWTRDFAATISRRMIPAFESASLGPKSLENRRIRVRGVVSSRGGPRIELLRVGQIEVLGGK